MSPTQRSLAKLRADGWLVTVVEKWNSHARVTQDLFGFADLLAIKDGMTLLVQTTTRHNVSARLRKITASATAALWLGSPHRAIVVHGWFQKMKRKRWRCRIVRVIKVNLSPETLARLGTLQWADVPSEPDTTDEISRLDS
jgi:hypothetical protein